MKKIIAITALAVLSLAGANAQIRDVATWDFTLISGSTVAANIAPRAPFSIISDMKAFGDIEAGSHAGGTYFNSGNSGSLPPDSTLFQFSLTASDDVTLYRFTDFALLINAADSAGATVTWKYTIEDGTTGLTTGWGTVGTYTVAGGDSLWIDEERFAGGIDLLAGDKITFQLVGTFGAGETNVAFAAVNDPSKGKSGGMTIQSIPEPSTWLLLGVGAAAIAVFRRRKQ